MSNIYEQKVELPESDGAMSVEVGPYIHEGHEIGVLEEVVDAYSAETVTKLVQEHMAKALEAAIMQVPGGDSCNPQHVADAIRNLIGKV